MPQVSVIVPVYKVEKYIRRCIDSILNQTYSDFELILVDDGSPDECAAICDDYAAKDERIRVIHKENGGVSRARNAALNVVTGKYLTFCDSDDYWEQGWLESLYTSIAVSGVDSVTAGYQCVSEKGELLRTRECEYNKYDFARIEDKLVFLSTKVFRNVLGWAVWGRIFRTSIINEHHIRFCETCGNFAEDLGFVVEYTLCSTSAISIESTGYCYLQRQESMMHQSADVVKLDAVNEISKQIWKRCSSLGTEEQNEISFPIIHFLVMNCQYCKITNSSQYPDLAKEIQKIQDKQWYIKQTRALFRCYSQLKRLFGKDYARRILLFSNYCLHGDWKRYKVESAFYYKVVSKL